MNQMTQKSFWNLYRLSEKIRQFYFNFEQNCKALAHVTFYSLQFKTKSRKTDVSDSEIKLSAIYFG